SISPSNVHTFQSSLPGPVSTTSSCGYSGNAIRAFSSAMFRSVFGSYTSGTTWLTRLAVNAVSVWLWFSRPFAARAGSGPTELSWSKPPTTSTVSFGSATADGYQRAYFWSEGSEGWVLCWSLGSQWSKNWALGSLANNARPNGSLFQFARVHGCLRFTHVSLSGSKMLTLYKPLSLCMSWPPKT